MLDQIKQQVERLKGMGAAYVDTRWYPYEETNSLQMWNGNLKDTSFSRESGVGVRVLVKGAWGFSASSDTGDLAGVYSKAFDNARIAAERVSLPVRLAEKDAIQASFTSPNQINPMEVPLAEKVAFLQQMDQKLDQPGVFQRVVQLHFVRKQTVFVDSEGSEIEKQITEVFAQVGVLGQDAQGEMHERSFSLGQEGKATRGWESIDPQLFGEAAER